MYSASENWRSLTTHSYLVESNPPWLVHQRGRQVWRCPHLPARLLPCQGHCCCSAWEHLPADGWGKEEPISHQEGRGYLTTLRGFTVLQYELFFLIISGAFQEIRRDFMKIQSSCAFYLYSICSGKLSFWFSHANNWKRWENKLKKNPFNKVDFLVSVPMGNLSKNVEVLSI